MSVVLGFNYPLCSPGTRAAASFERPAGLNTTGIEPVPTPRLLLEEEVDQTVKLLHRVITRSVKKTIYRCRNLGR